MFKKILIANRGEIAVRIIRACHEIGIATVAVYSDVDRMALHVRKSDEAYALGGAAASESYLNISKLLDVARQAGAEAVHPGYGFLSENARFALACEQAEIKFIGPSAAAMDLMESKTKARQAIRKAGLPLVPGSARALTSLDDARSVAEEVGYPIMLKAAAGGGKGMRIVHSPAELQSAMEGAQSEAQRAFGDAEVYVERALDQPRHIEVQIFADEHGNTVYLGERECSVQRRHQKVVEESPSPVVGPEMRRRMGETAVRVAQAAHYTNAGTVEFLVDTGLNFYFLEMNTRLQVEHPVTELVTGLDLVQLQIRVASGEPLPFVQEDVQLRGHAIECRIYAEDPDNNFFPSPGRITRLAAAAGPGIREDSGVYEGWTVPLEYDPLLAKLVGYGSTRADAIARLRRALDEYFVGGIKTNVALFRRILADPDFIDGKLDTGYLDRLLASQPAAPAAADSAEESTKSVAHEPSLGELAAVAAVLFALNGASMATAPSAAITANDDIGNSQTAGVVESSWKKTARQEGLR